MKNDVYGTFPTYFVGYDGLMMGAIHFAPDHVTINHAPGEGGFCLQIAKERADFIGVKMPPARFGQFNARPWTIPHIDWIPE